MISESVAVRMASSQDAGAISMLVRLGDDFHRRGLPWLYDQADTSHHPGDFLDPYLAEGRGQIWVAEDRGEVIGFLLGAMAEELDPVLNVRRTAFTVITMVVRETYRRKGVGSQLLRQAEAWAKSQGINDLELEVYEFNEGAIRAFENHGYETVQRRMRKVLSEPGWEALG